MSDWALVITFVVGALFGAFVAWLILDSPHRRARFDDEAFARGKQAGREDVTSEARAEAYREARAIYQRDFERQLAETKADRRRRKSVREKVVYVDRAPYRSGIITPSGGSGN